MIQTAPTPTAYPADEIADRYDVVVVGGGPAGATAAALLAEAGRSVLVLERSPVPRFHVGESLIPETYWSLQRLGLLEQLRASAFPKKYSVQFVSDGVKESAPFYFDRFNPHESSQTWQVVRADFDQMLLDNAIARGATLCTDAQVLDVLFDGEATCDHRAIGVRVKFGSGAQAETREIGSSVVVDATGQSSLLVNRLKLKQADPLLRKGTVWSYFRGALRDEGKDEGATIILQTPEKKSWFWYIPLPDDVVSVGCTANMHYLFGDRRRSGEEAFLAELERCPAMQRRLQPAERVTDYFTTRDYSYRARQGAGDGWVLIGDALGFIDPVYSSGVFLALKSGEFAADAIVDALAQNDLSAERLGSWQTQYTAGVDLFRKLVYAFYTPGFSFGQFLREHPQYGENVVDILIGNVFKPGVGDMFDALRDVLPPPDDELATVEHEAQNTSQQ